MQVNLNTNYNNSTFTGYNEAKRYAKRLRFHSKDRNRINMERLDGIQEGLKTFEGLNIKQILFAFSDLHSINAVSGCKNHCLHCYGNSQPNISRLPFEVFKQFTDDLSELRKRLGFKPVIHNGTPYTDTFFDADSLDGHIFDENGNKYDSIDIGNMLYKATGTKYVFDTNGFSVHDKEKQKLAKEYVEKLLKDKNYKNCLQINLSINPFNPKYVRALRNGCDPNTYHAIKDVSGEAWEAEQKKSEQLRNAEQDYDEYINDVVSSLLTFLPLLKAGKLGLIIRVLNNSVRGMNGFTEADFEVTKRNILEQLYVKLFFDASMGRKYVKSNREFKSVFGKYQNLISQSSTKVFSSGRLENLYRSRHNGSIQEIERIDRQREVYEACFNRLKDDKKMSSAKLRYLKIIAPDGRLYLYDNYHIIPTDIKFNVDYTTKRPPFSIKQQDFVFTTDMIDFI